MVGNLTHIMRFLIALCAAYLARNCPLLSEKVKDAFWVFSMTVFTLAVIGVLYATGEYWNLY